MKTKKEIKKMIETMRENSKLVLKEQTKMVLIEKMGVLEWVLKDGNDVEVTKGVKDGN